MEYICKNQETFKYILIIIKYAIPVILIILGFLKLVLTNNTKKALKSFLVFLLIGLALFFIGFKLGKTTDKCEVKTDDNEIKEPAEPTEPVVTEPVEPEEKIKIEEIDGVTYVDGIMIVNKTYSIPAAYIAPNSEGYEYCSSCLTSETLSAFNNMQADAQALGLNLYISSGYRSYSYQENLYNNYVYQDGKEAADTYSARPGHSEHQTGLAFDLNTIDDSFAYTDEGKWVAENCYKYGLILRYPEGKETQTGYKYESWHLRYVGKELAEKLYNNGNWITLEENFNLTSVYE